MARQRIRAGGEEKADWECPDDEAVLGNWVRCGGCAADWVEDGANRVEFFGNGLDR